MNDYIFFDATLRDRFLDYLAGQGLSGTARPDLIEGFVVAVRDDLADELLERIEAEYERLMDEQHGLVDADDDEGGPVLMAVAATLPDGRSVNVMIPEYLGRRLVEVFSIEEVHALVSAIAAGALDPIDGPLCCQRPIDKPLG